MKKFLFWQKTLMFSALYIIAVGLVIALFNHSEWFKIIFNINIDSSFWSDNNLSPNILEFQNWIYGVLGSTVVGWGIILLFIIHYPFKKKEKWAWNCIFISMSVWYILDTSISVYHEVYFNAIFNTLIFAIFICPLLLTKKYFDKTVV